MSATKKDKERFKVLCEAFVTKDHAYVRAVKARRVKFDACQLLRGALLRGDHRAFKLALKKLKKSSEELFIQKRIAAQTNAMFYDLFTEDYLNFSTFDKESSSSQLSYDAFRNPVK